MRHLPALLAAAMLLAMPAFAEPGHGGNHAEHASVTPIKNTVTAQLAPHAPLQKNVTAQLVLKLADTNGRPLAVDDLKIAHTKRVHLLVIDPTIGDYQHLHPMPNGKAGEWAFDFTPKTDGPYRMWADLLPTATGKQEYVRFDVGTKPFVTTGIDRTTTNVGQGGDNSFALSFDAPLVAGQASMANVTITGKDGKPFAALEPIMAAYAHIVAFSEDGESILHVHPMGAEPEKDTDRGGPALSFHFAPEKAGFVKLFIQTQVNGKSEYAPFGLMVAPAP